MLFAMVVLASKQYEQLIETMKPIAYLRKWIKF